MTAIAERPRTETTSRDDRAAIDKAICLLSSFGADASTGVGVSELARRARLSKSTAFRVLGTLERNHVVERVGHNYRLGARLQELGRPTRNDDLDRLRNLLIPACCDLYEMTHEVVHLSALDGPDVVALHRLFGAHTRAVPARVGERLPAHTTAAGKALLASDPEAMDELLSAPLRRLTPQTVTDPATLMRQLDHIRAGGVATSREESVAGVEAAALPVRGGHGRARAALVIVGVAGRLDVTALERPLRRVAAEASRVLCRAEHAGYLRSA